MLILFNYHSGLTQVFGRNENMLPF